MTTPEYLESELPAIELLKKLGYSLLQEDERETIHDVFLKGRLQAAIRRINPWIEEKTLVLAYREITSILASSLMEANQKAYKLLRGREFTVKQTIDGREQYKGVAFIDFSNLENNDFLIASQMKFKGRVKNSVPDIVIFVNGLPFAVIECKSPGRINAIEEAISDLKYYQSNSEKLFIYNQLCIALCGISGKYGAIGADSIHYQVYLGQSQDALLSNLLGRRLS